MPVRELPAYLHLAGPFAAGAVLTLLEPDAHYVARVCRAAPGDQATATDGGGHIVRLEIVEVGSRVLARCIDVRQVARASEAWVLCGAPEDGRADWLIEKLAEFGVAHFQPVDGNRGGWRGGRTERWRRVASAALRQSRQAHAIDIGEAMPLEAALAGVPADASRWAADALGARVESPRPSPSRIAGVIGPAGGWTEPELKRLEQAGFQRLCLAGARLRCETAALAWAAWWARGVASEPGGSPAENPEGHARRGS